MERKYKALAIDLDGTLLNPDHAISEEDEAALGELRRKGIPVIVVTGRTLEEVQGFRHCLNLNGDISILQGGAVIAHFRDGGVNLDYAEISREDRRKMIAIAERNGFYPLVYLGESPFTQPHDNPYHDWYEEMMNHKIFRVDDIMSVQENLTVGKLAMVAPSEVLDRAEKEMAAADLSVSWGRSFAFGTDICLRSKRQALTEVLVELGILPEETVAIGDSNNDMEMVQFAGLGIAMGNATEALKAAADAVTEDNRHSGVACAIRRYF